ncbi:unnamed protein product, partial [Tilletia controversa]
MPRINSAVQRPANSADADPYAGLSDEAQGQAQHLRDRCQTARSEAAALAQSSQQLSAQAERARADLFHRQSQLSTLEQQLFDWNAYIQSGMQLTLEQQDLILSLQSQRASLQASAPRLQVTVNQLLKDAQEASSKSLSLREEADTAELSHGQALLAAKEARLASLRDLRRALDASQGSADDELGRFGSGLDADQSFNGHTMPPRSGDSSNTTGAEASTVSSGRPVTAATVPPASLRRIPPSQQGIQALSSPSAVRGSIPLVGPTAPSQQIAQVPGSASPNAVNDSSLFVARMPSQRGNQALGSATAAASSGPTSLVVRAPIQQSNQAIGNANNSTVQVRRLITSEHARAAEGAEPEVSDEEESDSSEQEGEPSTGVTLRPAAGNSPKGQRGKVPAAAETAIKLLRKQLADETHRICEEHGVHPADVRALLGFNEQVVREVSHFNRFQSWVAHSGQRARVPKEGHAAFIRKAKAEWTDIKADKKLLKTTLKTIAKWESANLRANRIDNVQQSLAAYERRASKLIIQAEESQGICSILIVAHPHPHATGFVVATKHTEKLIKHTVPQSRDLHELVSYFDSYVNLNPPLSMRPRTGDDSDADVEEGHPIQEPIQ